jgi:hypothetical protein
MALETMLGWALLGEIVVIMALAIGLRLSSRWWALMGGLLLVAPPWIMWRALGHQFAQPPQEGGFWLWFPWVVMFTLGLPFWGVGGFAVASGALLSEAAWPQRAR